MRIHLVSSLYEEDSYTRILHEYLCNFLTTTDIFYHHTPKLLNHDFHSKFKLASEQMRHLGEILAEQFDRHFILNIGDGNIGLGSVPSFLSFCSKTFPNKKRKVLWFDKYPRLLSALSSHRCDPDKMTVGFLTKTNEEPFLYPIMNKLNWNEIIYIGTTKIEPYERLLLEKNNVVIIDDMNQILQTIGENNFIHIHIDWNIQEDLNFELFESIQQSNNVISADIVNLNQIETPISWNQLKLLILEMMKYSKYERK